MQQQQLNNNCYFAIKTPANAGVFLSNMTEYIQQAHKKRTLPRRIIKNDIKAGKKIFTAIFHRRMGKISRTNASRSII